MHWVACRQTPGSYRFRCIGGGTGGEVTTKLKRWLRAWHGGSTYRSIDRCGEL